MLKCEWFDKIVPNGDAEPRKNYFSMIQFVFWKCFQPWTADGRMKFGELNPTIKLRQYCEPVRPLWSTGAAQNIYSIGKTKSLKIFWHIVH